MKLSMISYISLQKVNPGLSNMIPLKPQMDVNVVVYIFEFSRIGSDRDLVLTTVSWSWKPSASRRAFAFDFTRRHKPRNTGDVSG